MTDQHTYQIPPRSGTAFNLHKGQRLTVIDPRGSQVSDLLAYNLEDYTETLSNGRTFDYNNRIYLSKGDTLYSNRSNKMLTIVEDTVGRHDFLITPCCKDTFRIKFGDENPHQGCFGNFADALRSYGILEHQISIPFNCFMNVPINPDGSFAVQDPLSKAGDHIGFLAEMDLLIALTACSAHRSNAGSFKPIDYRVE